MKYLYRFKAINIALILFIILFTFQANANVGKQLTKPLVKAATERFSSMLPAKLNAGVASEGEAMLLEATNLISASAIAAMSGDIFALKSARIELNNALIEEIHFSEAFEALGINLNPYEFSDILDLGLEQVIGHASLRFQFLIHGAKEMFGSKASSEQKLKVYLTYLDNLLFVQQYIFEKSLTGNLSITVGAKQTKANALAGFFAISKALTLSLRWQNLDAEEIAQSGAEVSLFLLKETVENLAANISNGGSLAKQAQKMVQGYGERLAVLFRLYHDSGDQGVALLRASFDEYIEFCKALGLITSEEVSGIHFASWAEMMLGSMDKTVVQSYLTAFEKEKSSAIPNYLESSMSRVANLVPNGPTRSLIETHLGEDLLPDIFMVGGAGLFEFYTFVNYGEGSARGEWTQWSLEEIFKLMQVGFVPDKELSFAMSDVVFPRFSQSVAELVESIASNYRIKTRNKAKYYATILDSLLGAFNHIHVATANRPLTIHNTKLKSANPMATSDSAKGFFNAAYLLGQLFTENQHMKYKSQETWASISKMLEVLKAEIEKGEAGKISITYDILLADMQRFRNSLIDYTNALLASDPESTFLFELGVVWNVYTEWAELLGFRSLVKENSGIKSVEEFATTLKPVEVDAFGPLVTTGRKF